MINADEARRRQLERLPSPQRIKWLRDLARGYVVDLAARHYFALPTRCGGEHIPDPLTEATAAVNGLGAPVGLTPEDTRAALMAEWNAGIALAEKVYEKLKIAALSHLKLTGRHDDIPKVLQRVVQQAPRGWPFLGEIDILVIARTFQRAPQHRGRRPA